MREFPSKWTPVGLYRERNCNVRIIDFFKIEKKAGQTITTDTLLLPVKTLKESHKINFGESSNLIDLEAIDCIHGEELTCSNILHKTIHSSDSICDYGEDITIERGILNWCDEHEVAEESRPLESGNAWSGEPSNLNNKPEISLMVETRRPIYHTKEVFMEYFPALWDCLSSSSTKYTPMEHEPPLWETDVSVVLSDEPIVPYISDKDVNSALSDEPTEPCTSDKDVYSVDGDSSHVTDTNPPTSNF